MSAIGIMELRPAGTRPARRVRPRGVLVLASVTVLSAVLWILILRFPDTVGVAFLALFLVLLVLGSIEARTAARAG